MNLRTILADQMGSSTPYDLPGSLLSVGLAALLAFVMAAIAGTDRARRGELAALAAIVALAVALVRTSVPLALALVAVAVIARPARPAGEAPEALPRLAALCIGLGCGASAALVVAVGVLPISLLMRFAGNGRGDRRS